MDSDWEKNGSKNSSIRTHQSTLANHLALILFEPNVSTKQTLISILLSRRRYLRRRVYCDVMSTTWMRKVASGKEGEGCNQSNSLYPIHINLITNFTVETSSSLQSLSASVQMVLLSHLDSSFQGNNSTKDSLLTSWKEYSVISQNFG